MKVMTTQVLLSLHAQVPAGALTGGCTSGPSVTEGLLLLLALFSKGSFSLRRPVTVPFREVQRGQRAHQHHKQQQRFPFLLL